MTTKSRDIVDIINDPLYVRIEGLERFSLILATALAHALEGDIQVARRLSEDVRVMGKPIPDLTPQDLAYLGKVTAR